ncbi:indole-3-glycerol phosphate synthase TrpC [Pseudoneobacillus rhizosphaerae]|uniref:Indole-3-glycerol phosphate synthase n=1 Tax=Pseudoneobacillus rhizosphaerae TaxID=2880968 RepID=A0A9C7GDQ1_9BACI|nr:indole-3-glycerol phosphate synthase TrpC [Pseudoneobacillus rhizosphaerae]CAG9610190.1 Indole-3-glycerol phosphate synthase [Pseudoneobacillus rhizosphaerae]
MGTILERIISEKKFEIKKLKEMDLDTSNSVNTKNFSLVTHLQRDENLAIIAEFKRASPSKGNINMNLNPALQAKSYELGGAAAISVLTDSSFFKGSFQDLKAVREAVNIPILCKDFIIDKVQIDFAKHYGASIILLIAAALTRAELENLFSYAIQQKLEVLVEVHDEDDVQKALSIKPRLIGINNRNLKTFEVNLEVTERLAPIIQSNDTFIISESGIFLRNDADRVRKAGVNGVLVGEALMRSEDLSTSFRELRVPLRKEVKE